MPYPMREPIDHITTDGHRAEALRLLAVARRLLSSQDYEEAAAFAAVAGVHATLSTSKEGA